MGAMLAAGISVSAGEQRFASGPARTPLVELYTSEGCSSCPPAERWLGTLRGEEGLWRDFVPVEFHVNYWDQLGWPDRFATAEFTRREYAYAAAWGSASVYTPCVVRGGAEWKLNGALREAAPVPAGILAVTLVDGLCRVEFAPTGNVSTSRVAYEVHVAWLEGGVVSKVAAGENRGRTLVHEFVASALANHDLTATDGKQRAEFSLPPRPADGAPRRALAAWVTRRGEVAPLQATGGWIDP